MGFFDKLKKAFSGSIKLDEDFFEAMEETLILGDLGVSVATDAVEQLRTAIKKEHLQTEEEVKDALRRILTEMLRVGDTALDLFRSALERAASTARRRRIFHRRCGRAPANGRLPFAGCRWRVRASSPAPKRKTRFTACLSFWVSLLGDSDARRK